jgi:hypothetical protein
VDLCTLLVAQKVEKKKERNMPSEDKHREKSNLQMYSAFLAKITSAIAVVMTYVWAKTDDTDEKFLGGLNWNDKVFNWYIIILYQHN